MPPEESELYRIVSLIERAPNRKTVLETLNGEDVYTPSEIAEEVDILRQNVSRVISTLEEEDLINCLTPEAKQFRYYEITDKGKVILKTIEER